ncbi:hypothetical protein AB832_03875 [Flavobacteriaceae bacterium (ex Bugula neritina AB1)]|nr:hypothetical protein AB832_03875 [Flavobacteriaceae bacterium (ex Bugula neritina AB1)]
MWWDRLRKKDKLALHNDITSICNSITSDITEEIERCDKEYIYRKHFMKLDVKCRDLLYLLCKGKSVQEVATSLSYSEAYIRKKKFKCKECLLRMIRQDPMFKELSPDFKEVLAKGA